MIKSGVLATAILTLATVAITPAAAQKKPNVVMLSWSRLFPQVATQKISSTQMVFV